MGKVILASLLSIAGFVNLLGEPVAVSPAAPWKASADLGAYSIDYDGKGYPGLSFQVDAAPGEFYKVSWMLKSQRMGDEPFSVAMEGPLGKGGLKYLATNEWNCYSAYLFSGPGGAFKIWIHVMPGSPGLVEAKGIEVSKLSSADLTGNLLPDGDFEHSAGSPADWRNADWVKGRPLSIAPAADFISGEHSMAVEFKPLDGGKELGVNSLQMPVVSGKEYEFRFWAKAQQDFVINVDTQAWSPYGHKEKHFWKRDTFKITTEWKEYSLKVSIPDDVAQYPDLAARTVFVFIGAAAKDQECKVLFDDMSFKQLSK
jgi:hypothetical protein